MCAVVHPDIPPPHIVPPTVAAPELVSGCQAVSPEFFVLTKRIPHFHRNVHHVVLEWNGAGVDPIDGVIHELVLTSRVTGHGSQP